MQEENQALWIVSELARALAISRQAVERTLREIPPSGQRIVCGVVTKGWHFCALPAVMQERLNRIAEQRGCGSAERLRANAAEPFVPPIPLKEIEERFIEKAALLQKALQPSLARRNDSAVSPREFLESGLEDYARVFGYTISEDHWRYLFKRVLDRDRGLEQWSRLELFLDDAAFRRRKPGRQSLATKYLHRELDDSVQMVENKLNPSLDDKALFLHRTFEHFEALAEARSREVRVIKSTLIEYIRSAIPGLSKGDATAWKRLFNDCYKRWREGGRVPNAVRSQCYLKSGRAMKCSNEEEVRRIGLLAAQLEGNVTGAATLLAKRQQIPNIARAYDLNAAAIKGGDLPRTIQRSASNIAIQAEPLLKGPRAEEKALPRVRRDWSDCMPGDEFEADDLTIPIYWRTDAGEIVRGECLVFADRRTRMVLDFVLNPRGYNSELIRRGISITVQKYGCPRFGFVFENGVWKSRMITGEKRATAMHWRKTEIGLAQFFSLQGCHEMIGGLHEAGIGVRHARPRNPQTKIIEGVFNHVQNRMALAPGFVGRNERLDGYDRALRMISDARKGKQAAMDELFTFSEMVRFLEALFFEYNQEPQFGQMLDGKSPAQAWTEYVSTHPLRKLPEEARFLLASDMRVVKRRRDGSIHLKTGGVKRVFWSKETDLLPINQSFLAFWHLEAPGLITITDMKRQKPITVPERCLPSRTATADQFREIREEQRSLRDSRRARFSDVRAPIINTISRDRDFSAQVRETGAAINEQIAQAEAADAEEARRRVRLEKQARERGIDPALMPKSFEAGCRLEQEALREIEELEKGL